MSSLEERREARRRRRQQEEEELMLEKARSLSRDDVKNKVDARLAARRLERQQRRAQSQSKQSEDTTTNHRGDDEQERRRQERRKLRQADNDRSGGQAEEDTSSRRSRRRGTEDENASEETTSHRRRHRNREEEEEDTPAPKEPEPALEEDATPAEDNSAEEERRRQEEEEAEAERQRQRQREEDERRRRQEEERRQIEEKRRRGHQTPRRERQSRAKERTPRGPLKTPRSARQQKTLGDTSARSVPEENESVTEDIRFKRPEGKIAKKNPIPAANEDNKETCHSQGHGNVNETVEETVQLQLQEEQDREGKRAELFSKSDVKSRIRALEAETNPKGAFTLDADQSKLVFSTTDTCVYVGLPSSDAAGTSAHGKGQVTRVSPPPPRKPLQSKRSSSDTDWDDRLTDIVANNRAMLSNDDTMERFTDFDLGSCSSYDDIFGPKPKAAATVAVLDGHNSELMSTDEFTPVFHSSENIHERTLVDSEDHLDSTFHASPQLGRKVSEPIQAQQQQQHHHHQQQQQHFKSILKTKLLDESSIETSSIKVKNRSTQRERDLRRSNSRTRTRPANHTESSSDSSSEYDGHFIPFTVDKDDAVLRDDNRRSSVVERKVENIKKDQESTSHRAAHQMPKTESMSENDSLFSGDDVSARNSVGLMTSTDNLSGDSEDVGEISVKVPRLDAAFMTSMDNSRVITDPHFATIPVVVSPARSPKTEMLKVREKDQGDSDNSLEPITASGFFGVKSDIPFNAKKKKINARRSGQKISQMTSIWSKMPSTVISPTSDGKKDFEIPRKISVIKSSDNACNLTKEIKQKDEPSLRHKNIETRMTELQNQLKNGTSVDTRPTNSPVIVISTDKSQVSTQEPNAPVRRIDSRRNSGKMKEQLDELFGKLNSKLRAKDTGSPEFCYSETHRSTTPIFLAPFDSSVEALQRSQSQPILTSNEQLEYYDPSQSVREYIPDDLDSKTETNSLAETAHKHADELPWYQSEHKAGMDDEQVSENYGSSQSSKSSRKDSNIAQYSSGSMSPRLESSLSNWSNRSVLDVSSDNNCPDSESFTEECTDEAFLDVGEESSVVKQMELQRPAFKRKISAFSVASRQTDNSNEENMYLYNGENLCEELPYEHEVQERRIQTEEWLQEDVGFSRPLPCNRSSTMSNADSGSDISVDSLDQDYPNNDYQDNGNQGKNPCVPLTPRSQAMVMAESPYRQIYVADEDNPPVDLDLKLPLHFLHESSQEEEEHEEYRKHATSVKEVGGPESGRYKEFSHQDDYYYSSDDFEDENTDHETEEGESIMRNGVGYEDEVKDLDVITSMNEMGQEILNYLSDEMAEEGEVEEWGDEDGEENEDSDVIRRAEKEGGEDVYSSTGVSHCSNLGKDYDNVHANNMKNINLQDGHLKRSTDAPSYVEDTEFIEDNSDLQYFRKMPLRERASSCSPRSTLERDNAAEVTDSARVREMFKEHHGHIDDKDIVHRDNIPKGHELPDTDEFFLSFEYDEEHHRSLSDPQVEFSDSENEFPAKNEDKLQKYHGDDNYDNMAINTEMDRNMNNSLLDENDKVFSDPTYISDTHFFQKETEAADRDLINHDDSSEEEDFCTISKGLRKQLVAELKLFDPKRLRKTSSETSDQTDGTSDQRVYLLEDLAKVEKDDFPKPMVEVPEPFHAYNTQQNIVPHDFQALPCCSVQLKSAVTHPTEDPDQPLSLMQRTLEEEKSHENNDYEPHEEHRRGSVGENTRQSRSGSMSRERRKSIRSFWQQLDEERKKKHEMEENWRQRRQGSRTREETTRFEDTKGSASEKMDNTEEKLYQTQHQRLDDAIDTPLGKNEAPFKPADVNHRQLIHDGTEFKEDKRVFEDPQPNLADRVKPSKKSPPAVAPKPDKSRRRTIEISSTDFSKKGSKLLEKPKSVKEIAQFHEMQNKALQNIASVGHTSLLHTASKPPQPSKSVHTTEENVQKMNITEPNRIVMEVNESVRRFSGDNSGVTNNQEENSHLTKNNELEIMLQRRLHEKNSMSLKAPNVETVELEKTSEINTGNKNRENLDDQKFVQPSSISVRHVSMSIPSLPLELEDKERKIACAVFEMHPCQSEKSEKRNECMEIQHKQVIQSQENSFHSTPLFPQNITLKAPTLEEIDHLAGIDDTDAHVVSHHKSEEIVDKSSQKAQTNKSSHGKPQAPRPKFNAKALAKNNHMILPAFAKSIDTNRPASSQNCYKPIVPSLDLSTSMDMTDSESVASLDQIPSSHEETKSRELKSWVVDYLKDQISDRHLRHGVDNEPGKVFSDTASVDNTSANSSFYGQLPLQGTHGDRLGSFHSDGLSEPALSSRSLKEAKLSVAERITKMQEMMEASKESKKPVEKLNPTQSQRQFASLLQNRLIDVIAQESEDENKEKEREKKKKQNRPAPNSWAAERQRLFGKRAVKSTVDNFNPDSTSTPSSLSRTPTNPLIRLDIEESPGPVPEGQIDAIDSVQDAKSRLENLSESLSKDDVIKMNKVRRGDNRKYRRVTTTGMPFSDIREKFTISDSSGSSTESFSIAKENTRPNSPWIAASGPSPLVAGVINKMASAENTDVENSKTSDRLQKLGSTDTGQLRRGRVLKQASAISSGENSLSNSRSSSQSRSVKEIVSGAFDRNLVSELVRRVESSDESSTTSLSSSLSLQPGEFGDRAKLESSSTVTKVLQKFKKDGFGSSNSSCSSSLDKRFESNGANCTKANRIQQSPQLKASEKMSDLFGDRSGGHIQITANRLSQALETMAELQKENGAQSKNKRANTERRHTTQINFKELHEKYNSKNQSKDQSPPQSPALKAIYACSVREQEIDSDTRGNFGQIQIAQSNTFQRRASAHETTVLENSVENSLKKSDLTLAHESHTLCKESPLEGDGIDLQNRRNKSNWEFPLQSPSMKSSQLVSRNTEFEDEDVFSPLVSARVPEAFNLPSDSHPIPAFTFSATSYEDDMSHGELAESESSDTADFGVWRDEARVDRHSMLRNHHRPKKTSHQELKLQHPPIHYYNHHQQPQSFHSQHGITFNVASATSSPKPCTIPTPSRTVFPETIIDARTATGHVRCRILSETPLEPDESGIGASDNSLGSSTVSVASIVQDKCAKAPRHASSSSGTKEPTAKSTAPASAAYISTVKDTLSLPVPPRKMSLGNEEIPRSSEMQSLLSPRRASIADVDHQLDFRQGPSSVTTDTHSSNASLSQDSCKAIGEANTVSRLDHKRRKSKSKFMQDVMDKRRNASAPNENARKSSFGADGISNRRPTASASDMPTSPGKDGLFGPKVTRKKSQGEDNTMKGYSKRFDALWAKFDPEQTDSISVSSSRSAEEEEREREEAEQLERERMEAEEAARQKAEDEEKKKKKGKRKGLGGLTPEKKKLLKKLIMQKAAEDLRNEAKEKAAEKERYINERVAPLKTDGLGQSELQQLVKDLHAKVSTLEEEVYDWEIKIRKQDFEINELTLKVNDTKGKFIKPVLRKVNKTESKLRKIQQIKESTDFRGNLKSTGQSKYALEDEEPEKGSVHWRDELKPKDKQEGEEEAPAAETEVAAES